MRDLTLSLLSRGCGLVVRSHQDSQDGRLEVCFEPEDYYIWKSHQPLLRLSNSGRFLGGAEPVPPKTYSTRRGPLFLYSEDLASMTKGLPEVSRKREVSHQSRQEMDLHLHTLRDLTGAILAYGKKRLKAGTATATGLPSLPLPTVLDPLPPSSKMPLAPLRANRQPRPTASQPAREPGPAPPSSPRYHKPPTGLDPLPSKRFLSSRTEGMEPTRTRPLSSLRSAKVSRHVMEDCEEHMTEAGWKEKEAEDLRRFEVMVFTPRAHRCPMPETEPPWQVDSGGKPPGMPPNRASLNRTTKDPVGVGVAVAADERCYPLNMASVDTSWASSCPSLINFYGGHLVGVRHRQIVRLDGLDRCVQREAPWSDPSLTRPPPSEAPQCCLPPVSLAPLVSQGREAPGMTHDCNALEPRNPGHHLPTIQEGCVRPGGAVGPAQAQSERTEHQKILLLPLLTPAAGSRGIDRRGEDGEKCGGEREKHRRQEREKEDVGRGGKHAPPQKVRLQAGVLLEPEEECPPPLGVLPPLARRQGPARQYFLSQYRPDPQDETWVDPRTVVRGILPFELREGQKDQSWGTLIMGPDGEIIQLSLWDPRAETGGPTHFDDVTQENGLHVPSSEGEELPWIILLQPEATDADRQGGETTDPAGEGMKRNPEDILPNKDASHRFPAPRSGVQGILGDLQQRHPPGHRSSSHRDGTGQAPGAHYSEIPLTADKAERNISAAPANVTHNEETTKQEAREDAGKDVRKNMKKEPVKKRWKETEQVKTNRVHRQPAPQSHMSSPHTGQETSSSGHPASERPNLNPDPTEKLSQGTWSGKRNLRNSEGPLTPCGLSPLTRSGGFSENLEESTGSQRPQQRSGGQRQPETDHPTRRSRKLGGEPEKDSETLESTATDPAGIQKKTKWKGEKAEAIQRGSTKEEAGKTSSSGKTMKKGRVKHRAEFVVGKAKANMEVDPGEREEKVEGFKETSPVLSPDTVERDHMEEDQEDMEEVEEIEEEGEEGEEDSCLDLHRNPDDSEEEEAVLSPVSGDSTSPSNQGDSNKSSVGQGGQASSRGHLSSCSAIMATDQLALKPVVSETSNSPSTTKEDVAAARKEQQRAALAEKAERRRQEVERKRREREEERRRQQEREDREERMKMELEEEKRQRAEELRLKRLEEEEERKRNAEEEMERRKREQEEIERDRRRKEEKKRQLERLQRMRQQEEERRAAEMERQRLEEERRREDERKMLLEMEEGERIEYLRRQKEEEEERRRVEEERRKREHEAALWAKEQARLQAELLARQQAALEQQLRFRRGLLVEAEALGQTQDISRPWVYSYFTLLQLLGLSDPMSDPSTIQAAKEMT